jgi:hypothetical protein
MEERPPFKIVYSQRIYIEYTPGCVYFSYWLAKILPNLQYETIPNTIWLREYIKDMDKAMIIEHLAICQWGENNIIVKGNRPPLKPLDPASHPGWPPNIFPYDPRQPIVKREEPRPKAPEKEVVPVEIPRPTKIVGKLTSLFDD